jgi:hypothetical protein
VTMRAAVARAMTRRCDGRGALFQRGARWLIGGDGMERVGGLDNQK